MFSDLKCLKFWGEVNVHLLRRYGPGEVCDDPAEESVVRGEADEELQLVVLAQPRARRLDPRDQLRVHPEGRTEGRG